MSVPPPLRATSAERLAHAVEAADAAVDGGAHPDSALAKAAEDFGVPRGHLGLAVRAFNTGRAVRQLAAPGPWEKAANHPVATVDGVVAALTATTKAASADLSDYARPPQAPPKAVVPLPPLVPNPPARAKAAAAPTATPPAAAKGPSSVSVGYAAAAAFEKFAALVSRLSRPAYAAVKAAAFRADPDAAACAFDAYESSDYRRLAFAEKAASAEPDPKVPEDHPAVLAVRELGACKAAYERPTAPEVPFGYEKFAEYGGELWCRALPVCEVLGRPIVPPRPVKAASAPVEPAIKLADAPAKQANPGFLGGLKSLAPTPSNLGSVLAKAPPLGAAAEKAEAPAPAGPSPGAVDRVALQVRQDLQRIDQQAAVQDLLNDPRLRGANPQLVVDTYRQLSSLAPLAMSNPAVSGDLINRRLQTGPLSYYDLAQLTGIERSLSDIRKRQTQADEEND